MNFLSTAVTIIVALVALAALDATGASMARAQESGPRAQADPAPDPTLLAERVRRLEARQSVMGDDLAPPLPPERSALTEQASRQYQETLQAYYAYRRSSYEHRLAVFEWQFLSTRIIFAAVLLLVFAGIYFAAIQFHHGLRRRDGAAEHGARDATEFVFSLKGFKVRSPVLGVIVLTLSLAFFYLYLVYVYPIEIVL